MYKVTVRRRGERAASRTCSSPHPTLEIGSRQHCWVALGAGKARCAQSALQRYSKDFSFHAVLPFKMCPQSPWIFLVTLGNEFSTVIFRGTLKADFCAIFKTLSNNIIARPAAS